MDKFIARENVKHFRRELENQNGIDASRRVVLLNLLARELDILGFGRPQLSAIERHIARLRAIVFEQVGELNDLKTEGHPSEVERAQAVVATLNDLMTTYEAHREKIIAALA